MQIALSKSQNLIVLSRDPVIIHLLVKDSLLAVIISLWPTKVCYYLIVFNLNRIVLWSIEDPTRNSLSNDMLMSVKALLNPLSSDISFPVDEFHNLTKLSPPPVATTSPRGLKHKQVHSLLWAAIFLSVIEGN